ncbi:TPA: hypothetical protein HA244_04160 [Candidatus Micrarchaeota archaeon]|nr:hypothetical protein [Candidatus Micrarchaeota archaeon]
MVRFAHMSDVHLGAFREKELRELNIGAFEKAVDVCLERKADFVIIAGDFFDIALPEMSVVDRAVRKMREAQQQGLVFYLVYGSHDYSPTETSIIDVLCSAGVLVKVSAFEKPLGIEGEKATLKVFKDGKTGVHFAGLSARARALEEKDFGKIDFSNLASVPNPKVFIFHSAVTEFVSEELRGFGGGVSIRSLPQGFDYYATGHVHLPQVIRDDALKGKPLVYPGPLFASDYRDLEALSREKHGFWFCTLENGESKVERIELNVCDVEFFDYDAGGKVSLAVQQEVSALIDSRNLDGKVVLVRLHGVLQQGASLRDVPFTSFREKAAQKGARVFYLNRNSLEEAEKRELVLNPANALQIEDELFKKSLAQLAVGEGLKGDRGLALSKKLLESLKSEQAAGEAKGDFEQRLAREAKKVFELS